VDARARPELKAVADWAKAQAAPKTASTQKRRLSGLYAILDGFRLALGKKQPLTEEDVDAIFCEGLRFIERRGSLAKCVGDGLRHELWRRLAEAVQF
jgi:hypothetical protein